VAVVFTSAAATDRTESVGVDASYQGPAHACGSSQLHSYCSAGKRCRSDRGSNLARLQTVCNVVTNWYRHLDLQLQVQWKVFLCNAERMIQLTLFKYETGGNTEHYEPKFEQFLYLLIVTFCLCLI
jgi:hypothetical protein